MRLDDWGMRKYTSSKEVQPTKGPSQRHSILQRTTHVIANERALSARPNVDPDSNDEDDRDLFLVFPDGIRIPRIPLKVSELMALIPPQSKYAFEILVVKWQNDAEYMRTLVTLMKTSIMQNGSGPGQFLTIQGIICSDSFCWYHSVILHAVVTGQGIWGVKSYNASPVCTYYKLHLDQEALSSFLSF
jgi:hypothetical protein